MNQQFDIIIIGDSAAGNEAVQTLAKANTQLKIAFVSQEFKPSTARAFLHVEYIREEAILLDYKNRLFGCYLKNGDRLFATHLIIATGLKYDKLLTKNKQVVEAYNNTSYITKVAKQQPAIVVGCSDQDIKFALAIAKKYKQVYFCTPDLAMQATKTNIKKLNDCENIVTLPNAAIVKVQKNDNNMLTVDLDNYSTVTCAAIFAKTAAKPDTDFISVKLVNKTDDGFLNVCANGESRIVPKCFAIGNCTVKSTKRMVQEMCKSVISDF